MSRAPNSLYLVSIVLMSLSTLAGCGHSGEPAAREKEEEPDAAPPELPPFSFFVTGLRAMQKLSNSQSGFGGDLRFGKGDGLSGADEICRQIAESSMEGSGQKPWRAFLSVTAGEDGAPVHAIDRVGDGPWFDRIGRLVAQTREDLVQARPRADPAITNDLPNEEGLPNHAPDGSNPVDNHDVLTGTDREGHLFGTDSGATCHDWTSAEGGDGHPRVGHSWPRDFGDFLKGGIPLPTGGDGGLPFPFDPTSLGDFSTFDPANWMSSLNEAGCAPGVGIIEMGPPNPSNPTVGSGGGYGAIYCFSTVP